MSDSPSSGPLGLPSSVWITLILSAAGLFALTQKPFQDTRPPATMLPLSHQPSGDGQVIEARLWEDPLSAVALACSNTSSPAAYDVSKLRESITQYAAIKAKTLVLAVMVTGEPYTDDIETRRRTRYSVLAGLYRSSFVPANSNHIGYVVTNSTATQAKGVTGSESCGSTSSNHNAATDHVITPFEWFRRDSVTSHAAEPASAPSDGSRPTAADHILVLWLDQEGFRDLPIRKLARFLTSVTGDTNKLVDVAVLGPADSDGLHAMYDEVQRAHSTDPWQGDLRELNIYSPRATASDESITKTASDGSANLTRTLYTLTGEKVRFYRTVANDQDVEEAVWAELRHRGIYTKDKIALVAERDTLYARGMGRYFGGCRNPPRDDPGQQSPKDTDAHVSCFTYLKGLDGIAATPYASTSSDDAAASSHHQNKGGNQSAPDDPPSGTPDAAVGPSQLDSLRRLASSIAGLRDQGIRIRAIGVISSDMYDKLLVLQALRNALPGVTFFTFDLDARLLESKNLRWTRELIVGSSLGLALRPELQGDIPPFRDNYQTTTFYATLLAVHRFVFATDASSPSLFDPRGSSQAGLQWAVLPRVFEIGRSQAFDLTAAPDDTPCAFDGLCCSISPDRQSWLWSQSHVQAKGLLLGVLLAAIGLAAVAIAAGIRGVVGLSRTHRVPGFGECRWNNEKASALLAIVLIVATFLLWPAVVTDVLSAGLPAPLLGGANQWISSIADAFSIFMVVLLVLRGQRKLNDNAESVGREFGIGKNRKKLIHWHRHRRRQIRRQDRNAKNEPPATTAARTEATAWELPRWLVWFWFPLRPLSRRSGIDLADNDISQLEAIIAQYLHHGTASARVRRVLPVTIAVVLFLVIPLEEIPGIAHLGRSLDLISLLSLFAMQFLIFWCADALLLSRSFILALKRDKPAWPKSAQSLGLPLQQATRWLDLRLVAARTRGVSGLVWYPSFVIAVMAVAALTIQFREFQFANNPIALAVGTLFVVGSAVALRRAAEALRGEVTRSFENEQLRASPAPSDKQIELLLARVADLREGAFAPYSEQPIVRAVLVPAATYGATVGLQYLHLGS